MKIVKKTCLAQQMTEKIAVEIDEKNCFEKKCENWPKSVKIVFLNAFFYPFQKSWIQSETIF